MSPRSPRRRRLHTYLPAQRTAAGRQLDSFRPGESSRPAASFNTLGDTGLSSAFDPKMTVELAADGQHTSSSRVDGVRASPWPDHRRDHRTRRRRLPSSPSHGPLAATPRAAPDVKGQRAGAPGRSRPDQHGRRASGMDHAAMGHGAAAEEARQRDVAGPHSDVGRWTWRRTHSKMASAGQQTAWTTPKMAGRTAGMGAMPMTGSAPASGGQQPSAGRPVREP